MAELNPAPIRIPDKLLKDKELSKYFQELSFYIFQLEQRTGGGTDIIEEHTEKTEQNTKAGSNAHHNSRSSDIPISSR